MKTNMARRLAARAAKISAIAVALNLAFRPQITRGAAATNFTISNHATGKSLSLYDYKGSVVVLDFWAYWCEYCQAAASDIEPNITRYYRDAGGNSNGVPVTVISISIDLSDPALENSYIQTYGLELVGDDPNWVAYGQFNNSGSIPQFAVINGATNSVNYGAWQVLSAPLGYEANYTVPLLKSYIDSVRTPAPVSAVTSPANGAVVAPPNVPLAATVASNGKIIKKVEFYNGATLLASTTNASCSLIWSNVPVGVKSVFARVCYGANLSADSAAVNFTVAEPVRAELSAQGASLVLSWTGGAGNFQVQTTTNLASGVWQNYGAAGPATSLVVAPTNQAMYYRVRWP